MGISSFQILAMFRRGLFYSYLSIYLRFFLGLTVTETTFFATFPMVLNVVFATFVWGAVSDRFQVRRTLIIIGEICASVSTFVVWYLHTIPESKYTAGFIVIIGLSLVEILWSMSNVGWSALLSDLYPEQKRAGLRGSISSIGAIGNMVGVWVGGLAYDGLSRFYEGWGFDQGFLFFVASGVMALSTIPIFFLPEGGIHLGKEVPAEKQTEPPRSRGKSRLHISKAFLFFLISMTLVYFGKNSIALLRTQYLVLDEGFNVSSRFLGYIMSMGSIGIFIFGMSVRKLTTWVRDETLLVIGILVSIAYLLGFALARNLPMIFASTFLGGASQVVILSTSYAYASRLIPAERRGRQFAMYDATRFLSWGLPATFIMGPLVDRLIGMEVPQPSSYRAAFFVAASMVVVGTLILLYTIRLERKSHQTD